VVETVPRGIRTNNPGNIKHSAVRWAGMTPEQPDDVNVSFTSPLYGIAAMVRLLGVYESKYGLKTIAGIIQRWSPPSENDTDSYIGFVCHRMGVNPDFELDLADDDRLIAFLKAVITMENGKNPYPDFLFPAAIALARAG